MDFKNIKKEYRPLPFWSWNEKLDTKETKRQVKVMQDAGISGYFMHARGGLITDYMGEEWFDNILAACEEGEKRNMRSWAYDENGWPSGFADGEVLALGEDYHQKALVYKPTAEYDGAPERVVYEKDGITYYYEVNNLYVDLVNPAVTEAFIKCVHEKYKEKCGDRIEGFFTDEPQLSRSHGFPYSVITLKTFEERYGYDLKPYIPSLFFDDENSARVRFDYFKMMTDLFSENFFKKIYDWCEENGYKLTGHLMMEDNLEGILLASGASMPHYEYFHIPGMDWLGRPLMDDILTPKCLGSAAAQLGRKHILSETFALTGHNVSHAELKRIYEWQMVRGINILCPHLEGYSNRGLRKRDYPVAMYYQQPWWDDAKIFFDTVSRIGMLLGEGKIENDTLLIMSTTKAWCMFNGFVDGRSRLRAIREVSDKLCADMKTLENKNILYDLGDETLMERHGRVEDGALVIGNMRYKRVIIPEDAPLFDNTKRLIDEFVKAGGEITTAEAIPHNPVTDINPLTYTKRAFDGYDVHYFVNTEAYPVSASFSVGNLVLDPETGITYPFSGECTLDAYESLILIDNGQPRAPRVTKNEEKLLSLLGQWNVKEASYNSITLDRCDFAFDGELIAKDGYVLDILPRINEKRRPVKLWQKYRFMIEKMPSGDIFLATETPELFDIKVNGEPIVKKDVGDFRDISFRRLEIKDCLVEGENTIEFESVICQREKTFEHIEKSWRYETMSNCLTYDVEVEPIYIVGDFGVKITAPVTELEREAYRVKELIAEGGHSFAITEQPTTADAQYLENSGYPQFSGKITLTKKVTLTDTDYFAKLVGRGMNSVHLKVNGKEVGARMFGPYAVSLKDALKVGENELELTLINNLRNMQGPTHLKEGECYFVNRNVFYRESNVLLHKRGCGEDCHDVSDIWDDDVCLVHFGLTEDKIPLTQTIPGSREK